MKTISTFINLSLFLQQVASLSLKVQPNTLVAHPSLLFWTRQPADGNNQLDFDLRFVEGADQKDAGVAMSGIHASPTQQFGTAQVVFPTQGSYEVIAVNGPKNLGTSNNVNAIVLPSATTTISSATATSTPTSASSASVTRPKPKTPVIVGSIFAALILLAGLSILIMFLIRRRRETTKRTSPSIPSFGNLTPHSQDLEQGLHTPVPIVPSMIQDPEQCLPDPIVGTTTQMAERRGRGPVPRRLELDPSHDTPVPRLPTSSKSPYIHQPPLKSSFPRSISPGIRSPIPRSPSPRTHRQRAIADQIEILRIQMLEYEREGWKDEITMDEMCKKMAWFREQQEGPWALGLSEEVPLGYDHYMTSL